MDNNYDQNECQTNSRWISYCDPLSGYRRCINAHRFPKAGFKATEIYRLTRPDGKVGHAEVRIGDSVVMLGDMGGKWKSMPSSIYLYVPDTDEAYRQALGAGAISLMEPADQFYGDRSAGVRDPFGNHWFLATHVEDVPAEELARREQEFLKKEYQS